MRFYLLALLLLFTASAARADFCQDANLVVDTRLTWNLSEGFEQDFALPTHRAGILYPSKTVLYLKGDGRSALDGLFAFQSPVGQAEYEYNLFRLSIEIGNEGETDHQIIEQDYTEDCTGPGFGLMPGDHVSLKTIKIEPHADGTPRAMEAVHLRFWGK